MRTLEKPISPTDPVVYRIRCNNRDCKALMEVAQDELEVKYDHFEGISYSFHCPHCQKMIVTAREVLPSKRWHKANVGPICDD